MSNIEKIRQEIERRKKENMFVDLPMSIGRYYEDRELLAFIDSLPEEKPSEDLEEAAVAYSQDPEEDGRIVLNADKGMAFIAGAKWQKEQMMDEWLKDRDGCFWDGVNEGKKAMKEQMMKEAVEGEVVKDINNKLAVTAKGINLDGFKFGQKVKIIVIKDERID